MDDAFAIPRTLDDPPLFFMWQIDEASVVILWGLLCGVLSGMMFVPGVVFGIVCAKQLAKVKAEGGRGLLIRALYWYTPSDWWLPSLTPSHVREYVGG